MANELLYIPKWKQTVFPSKLNHIQFKNLFLVSIIISFSVENNLGTIEGFFNIYALWRKRFWNMSSFMFVCFSSDIYENNKHLIIFWFCSNLHKIILLRLIQFDWEIKSSKVLYIYWMNRNTYNIVLWRVWGNVLCLKNFFLSIVNDCGVLLHPRCY